MSKGRSTPPYWVVWREDGHAPRFRHASPEEAEREARRLAAENPNTSFVVLAPLVRVRAQTVSIERFDVARDEIPF